jgi:KipI family sensor histidine kinase inhibitor
VSYPRLRDAGDSMLLLEFDPVVDVTVNARAIGTAAAVRARSLPGVRDVRATLRSVAVDYDPLVIDRDELAGVLMGAAEDAVPRQGRELQIPVVYGGDGGPDLTEVASRSAMREADVVAAHADRWYHAFMIGFVPGFPYLGPVSDRIDAPRRATRGCACPQARWASPAADRYLPRTSPGGWALVGRTNVRLFDPGRTPAAWSHLVTGAVRAGRASRLRRRATGPAARSTEPGALR